MSNDSASSAWSDETPALPDIPPPEWVDEVDAVGTALLDSDFARYFVALPEPPPDEGPIPDPTFEDLLLDAETIAGADRVAARARNEDPGPATALMLDAIARRRLSATGLLDAACAAERLASWTQAVQHRYLSAFARPGICAPTESLTEYASAPGQPLHQRSAKSATGTIDSSADSGEEDLSCSGSRVYGDSATTDVLSLAAFKVASAEVAAALRVSPISANRRVSQAVDFADGLPATLAALQSGMIDRGRARVIADRTQNLPADLRIRVEQAVVPKAATRNAGQLRGIVDRAVVAADPAAAKKRQEAARRNRGVSLRAGEDGMSAFRADLPADKACTAFSVIDQIALINSRRATEHRPINALRADAFSDIFDQLADYGSVHLHTILGTGHTNVDPGRPCPNHPESTSPSAPTASASSAAGGPRAADRPGGGGLGDQVATSTSPAGSSEEVTPAESSFGEMSCSADPFTTVREHGDRGGIPTDMSAVDAQITDTNENSIRDSGAGVASTTAFDMDPASTSTSSTSSASTTPSGACAELTSAISTDAISTFDPWVEHATIDAEQQTEASSNATGRFAESGGPPRQLTAPILATHAAEHVPTSAVTDCGCHEPTARAATPPVWGLGTHQGRATGLNVTIAATTLAGLDELPGELDGHGAIPADLARALAASAATITAIAVKPACGTALDLGRTVYRPRQAQRDYVNQRDQTCRFPSCRQPAWRCQLDHSNEFCPGKQDGGITCPCNLACLCKFHHDLKTFGLWDTEHHADDSITFISPTGRAYTTHTREWLTGMVDSQIAGVDVMPTTATSGSTNSEPKAENGDNDDPPF